MRHDKYKDKMGRYRTKSLFKEMCYGPDADPVYTLKDYDDGPLPSAKKIYLAAKDPTEYQAAMDLLGSWSHWKKLIASDWFNEHLTQWREELEVIIKSEAVRQIAIIAQDESNTGLSAAKFIAKGDWKQKEDNRGRPSKEEVERELRVQAGIEDRVSSDLERLGLKALN